MLLDTSESAWTLFLSLAQKAKDASTIWHSPKLKHSYAIEDVDKKITIRRKKGEVSELGKRGFLHFLEHFNSNNGRFKRTDYKGHVAKMACIVNFHPLLEWTADNEIIQVVINPSQGLISYRDYGAPPDDDITQLQAFARKVRNGQVKFRQQLLSVYGKCCVTGNTVEETLDACHIESHSKRGINQLKNGLILRSDIHNLFDLNLLFIEPISFTIHIHPKLKGTDYYQYHNQQILHSEVLPGNEFLAERWRLKEW